MATYYETTILTGNAHPDHDPAYTADCYERLRELTAERLAAAFPGVEIRMRMQRASGVSFLSTDMSPSESGRAWEIVQAAWESWQRSITPADYEDTSSAAATLGRKGGSARSEAKAQAARANGRLGGRPVLGSLDEWEVVDSDTAEVLGAPTRAQRRASIDAGTDEGHIRIDEETGAVVEHGGRRVYVRRA